MATLGIFSRVFLFHFEKISDHFSLFQVFRDVSVNTGKIEDLANMKFVLKKKKKKFLKPKQICIMYTEKPQREKNEKKKNEQRYLYNKL